MVDKPTVLALVRFYLPGYKSGGPVRTLANMVDRLGEQFRFRIITTDRDMSDGAPYAGVMVDEWNRVGDAKVFYASPAALTFRRLSKLIADTPHEVLYLNSFFHRVFATQPLVGRRLGLLRRAPVVLAPRGEFSAEALKLKRWKKALYMKVAAPLGLYRDLVWQASSDLEAEHIQRRLGSVAKHVVVAPNVTRGIFGVSRPAPARRQGGVLRLIFLSRIAPMKNLDYALQVLGKVHVPVKFNIYGPVEDARYWHRCQRLMDELPGHVDVEYEGDVRPADVGDVLQAHDLFFLPTRGENYGHVIAEALAAGTPVLISDATAWRGLEKAGVGWDLPLDDQDRFARCIEYCARLEADKLAVWRDRVWAYGAARMRDPRAGEANRRLFEQAIARA